MTNIKNEVLVRLQNGEDAQAIANEIADMLNAALDEHEAQKEAELKAKAEVEKQERLDEIADKILHLLDEYLTLYRPDLVEAIGALTDELDVDDIHEAFEQVVGMLDVVKALKDLTPKAKPESKPAVTDTTLVHPVKDTALDPLMDFLRKNGLLN